jgi:hypothetical protein
MVDLVTAGPSLPFWTTAALSCPNRSGSIRHRIPQRRDEDLPAEVFLHYGVKAIHRRCNG